MILVIFIEKNPGIEILSNGAVGVTFREFLFV